jgi:hypothetical protein
MRILDKIIVCIIAAVQLCISGYDLLYFGSGHGPAGVTAYCIWGLLSALALFTATAVSRLVAILWQAFMLGYFLLKARTPQDTYLPAAWIAPAMIYLTVTAMSQFQRNRQTSNGRIG